MSTGVWSFVLWELESAARLMSLPDPQTAWVFLEVKSGSDQFYSFPR